MMDLKVLVVSLINHEEKMMTNFISKSLCEDLTKYANSSEEVIMKHKEYLQSKYK